MSLGPLLRASELWAFHIETFSRVVPATRTLKSWPERGMSGAHSTIRAQETP